MAHSSGSVAYTHHQHVLGHTHTHTHTHVKEGLRCLIIAAVWRTHTTTTCWDTHTHTHKHT